MVDVHEGMIPDPSTWLSDVELSLDGMALPPVADYSTAFRSEHHLTLALQFPRVDMEGRPIATDAAGTLTLAVPDFEPGSGTLDAQWALPLSFPAGLSGGSGDFSLAAVAGTWPSWVACWSSSRHARCI